MGRVPHKVSAIVEGRLLNHIIYLLMDPKKQIIASRNNVLDYKTKRKVDSLQVLVQV